LKSSVVAHPATGTITLVKNLGITQEQAQGGAGAIFQVAKGKLDAGQFAELSKALHEMDSLLSGVRPQLWRIYKSTT
jgi:hypothetical protein